MVHDLVRTIEGVDEKVMIEKVMEDDVDDEDDEDDDLSLEEEKFICCICMFSFLSLYTANTTINFLFLRVALFFLVPSFPAICFQESLTSTLLFISFHSTKWNNKYTQIQHIQHIQHINETKTI